MKKFYEAEFEPLNRRKVKELAKQAGTSIHQIEKRLNHIRETDKVYLNDLYQVNKQEIDTAIGKVVWLSIKRLDKDVIHDWRHLQQIKNELVGPENEGVELYPAESRLVDTSNQYHLFVLADPKMRFPFGYADREILDGTGKLQRDGTRQRPFEK